MKVSNQQIKDYWELTKPGIIYGNLLTFVAGFLFASGGVFDIRLFLTSVIGTTFVIAGSCVINNVIDAEADKKMKRTRKRAMVKESVSFNNAVWFGFILSVIGFIILIIFTNIFVVAAGAIAVFSYLVLYSWSKRKSWLGTVVGTIPGAIPLLAGYLAVENSLGFTALLLFLIMVVWQLPHFYALGIFRMNDYRVAGIPILPVQKGIVETKTQIILFLIVFLILIIIFSFFGGTGITFFLIMFGLSLFWLNTGLDGIRAGDDSAWGIRIFKQSLIVLLVFSILLSLEVVLP